MAHPSVIETLIDLSTQQSEDAAKRLGEAARFSAQAQQKLDLLLSYREEYATQLQHRLSQGLTAAEHLNFRGFIRNLDLAVEQQAQVLAASQRSVENQRSQWQLCERKRLSFDTLSCRARQEAQHKESRREQKQTDEQAARRRPTMN